MEDVAESRPEERRSLGSASVTRTLRLDGLDRLRSAVDAEPESLFAARAAFGCLPPDDEADDEGPLSIALDDSPPLHLERPFGLLLFDPLSQIGRREDTLLDEHDGFRLGHGLLEEEAAGGDTGQNDGGDGEG